MEKMNKEEMELIKPEYSEDVQLDILGICRISTRLQIRQSVAMEIQVGSLVSRVLASFGGKIKGFTVGVEVLSGWKSSIQGRNLIWNFISKGSHGSDMLAFDSIDRISRNLDCFQYLVEIAQSEGFGIGVGNIENNKMDVLVNPKNFNLCATSDENLSLAKEKIVEAEILSTCHGFYTASHHLMEKIEKHPSDHLLALARSLVMEIIGSRRVYCLERTSGKEYGMVTQGGHFLNRNQQNGSIPRQKSFLENFCLEKKHIMLHGESIATNGNQAVLKEMEKLEDGSVLLVTSIDRLTREVGDVERVIKRANEKNVCIISLLQAPSIFKWISQELSIVDAIAGNGKQYSILDEFYKSSAKYYEYAGKKITCPILMPLVLTSIDHEWILSYIKEQEKLHKTFVVNFSNSCNARSARNRTGRGIDMQDLDETEEKLSDRSVKLIKNIENSARCFCISCGKIGSKCPCDCYKCLAACSIRCPCKDRVHSILCICLCSKCHDRTNKRKETLLDIPLPRESSELVLPFKFIKKEEDEPSNINDSFTSSITNCNCNNNNYSCNRIKQEEDNNKVSSSRIKNNNNIGSSSSSNNSNNGNDSGASKEKQCQNCPKKFKRGNYQLFCSLDCAQEKGAAKNCQTKGCQGKTFTGSQTGSYCRPCFKLRKVAKKATNNSCKLLGCKLLANNSRSCEYRDYCCYDVSGQAYKKSFHGAFGQFTHFTI